MYRRVLYCPSFHVHLIMANDYISRETNLLFFFLPPFSVGVNLPTYPNLSNPIYHVRNSSIKSNDVYLLTDLA